MGQGSDPTTIMLDQLMRVFLMEGMRAAIWLAVWLPVLLIIYRVTRKS